ncbi:hypothetical protein AB0425_12885 [Actinosynnema sp. NPDC051121]
MDNDLPLPGANHQSAHASDHSAAVVAGRDVHIGEINIGTGARVRTRYRYQVEGIAPLELVGREEELAALTAFCLDPATAGTYLWWRAPAWSGKSALLSWFVLNPPPGVRVVSFFITARLKNQSDRTAFVDNVMEQLLTISGDAVPALLTPATREQHLLGLLDEVARRCRDRGENLVLVVDGLDEDRGVTTGPDAYSIAALLPRRPPSGTRVVVSARPDPPVPGDVPDDHPLRADGIVRDLEPSPHARVLREGMERDLDLLLAAPVADQDPLGLVTAAGGGLTAADLAELGGRSEWDVRKHLRTVAGRSFATRRGRTAEVYLLAHEELHATASRMLGPERLAGYRDRLHAWADGYRERRWPAGTPEYLLGNYHALLTSVGDADRAVALSTDPDRQERLLITSGGHTAARAELTGSLAVLTTREPPDLAAIAVLALHRDHLEERGRTITIDVPGPWAAVGDTDRAVALALSVAHPHWQSQALSRVASATARAGDPDRARVLLDQAGERLRALTYPLEMIWARGTMATTALGLGDTERAAGLLAGMVRVADTIGDRDREEAWAAVAETAAEVGDLDLAARVVLDLPRSYRQSRAAAKVAGHAARAGRLTLHAELCDATPNLVHRVRAITAGASRAGTPEEAVALLDQAADLVGRLTEPADRAHALAAMAAAGREALLDEALQAVADVADPNDRLTAILAVARTAGGARVGELLDQATELAGAGPLTERLGDLAEVAALAADVGDLERTGVLLDRIAGLARSVVDPDQREAALSDLRAAATAAGSIGDVARRAALLDRAVDVIAHLDYPEDRCEALADLAEAAGDPDRAASLLDAAARLAGTITDDDLQGAALAAVSLAAARLGDFSRAVPFAQGIRTERRDRAVAEVVRAMAAKGDADLAEPLARSIADPGLRGRALVALGSVEEGYDLLRTITDPAELARALVEVAVRTSAVDVFGKALKAVEHISHPFHRDLALSTVCEAAAGAGYREYASVVARMITDIHCQNRAVAALSEAALDDGDVDRALAFARSLTDPRTRGERLAAVVDVMAADDPAAAREVADSIDHPPSRGRALAALANAATGTDALRLAVAAIAVGHWTCALRVLPRLSRPALRAVLDAVAVIAKHGTPTEPQATALPGRVRLTLADVTGVHAGDTEIDLG